MQSRPEIIGSDGGGIEALSRGPDVVSYALLIGRVRRASRPADRRVGFRISRSRSLLLADRHLHDLIALWQLPTFVQAVLQAEFDCLSNVPQSLVTGFSLTDTPRNHRAFCNYVTVFSRQQYDRQLHWQ